VVIANELRSEAVQAQFMQLFEQDFAVKRVPHAKLHPEYRHSSILLYVLKRRKNTSPLAPQADTCSIPSQAACLAPVQGL
jgi:hypothetical protein